MQKTVDTRELSWFDIEARSSDVHAQTLSQTLPCLGPSRAAQFELSLNGKHMQYNHVSINT